MKKLLLCISGMLFIVFCVNIGFTRAGEHPGKSVEHPGKAITANFVKKSIKEHINTLSKSHKGVFIIHDEKLNKDWKLNLAKIHDPVRSFEKDGKTIYFTCTDFKSVDSNDILDIDFWLVPEGNNLKVVDTKIHKLNGEPRYTYEGTRIKEIR